MPTDNAFAVYDLDETNIMSTNRTSLRTLLQYHIVEGMVGSSDIIDASPLQTAASAKGVTVSGTGVITDSEGGSAEILAADLASSNGIVHAISSVLLPFKIEVLDIPGRDVPEGNSQKSNVEIAALSAGLAAALILIAAAIAVHKRRQADAAKPPQVAPDDEGWAGAGRGASVHPA